MWPGESKTTTRLPFGVVKLARALSTVLPFSLSSSQASSAKANAHDSPTVLLASYLNFYIVLSSTLFILTKRWPTVLDLPWSTWPENITLNGLFYGYSIFALWALYSSSSFFHYSNLWFLYSLVSDDFFFGYSY